MVKLPGTDRGGPSEALRDAIERTFEATAGSVTETRERAGELMDELVRLAGEARQAPSAVSARVGDAIQGLRERDEVQRIEKELGSIVERLEKVESAIRGRDAGGRKNP